MALPRDFDKTLAALSDQELYEMVAHGSYYTPEAFEAGCHELARRNLDPTAVATYQEAVAATEAEASDKAQRPLPLILKMINFILPFGLLQMVIADVYGNGGQLRRQRECWSWMWRGLAFYVLLIPSVLGLDSIGRSFGTYLSSQTLWISGIAVSAFVVLVFGQFLSTHGREAERRAA